MLVAGWWLSHSEKYDFVTWDDDIPDIWENNKMMCPFFYKLPLLHCQRSLSVRKINSEKTVFFSVWGTVKNIRRKKTSTTNLARRYLTSGRFMMDQSFDPNLHHHLVSLKKNMFKHSNMSFNRTTCRKCF